jgi:flagellar hook assembly protein FlgD
VVVFIQDLVTKEVFQAANSVGTVLSVDDVNATEDAIAVYPNPSNGVSTIRFNLNNTNGVVVNVYNTLGQVVKSFDASQLNNGSNNLTIDTEAFASGIYTVKIEGNGFNATQKFVVE